MIFKIVPYSEADKNRWDYFLSKSHNGTFLVSRKFLAYHQERFHDLSVLVMDESDRILALFPAAQDLKDDKKVVSHPGITYAGLIYDGSLEGADLVEVLRLIFAHYSSLGYRHLEYKQIPFFYHRIVRTDDIYALTRLGAIHYRSDLTSLICLDFESSYSQRRIRHLTKANKAKLTIESGGAEYAASIWPMLGKYLNERHGVKPTHSLDEIFHLASEFPENIRFIVSKKEGDPVAGMVLFSDNYTIHAQYLIASDEGKQLGALDLIIDYALSVARSKNRHYFDFGISTEQQGALINMGLFRYKNEFGAGSYLYNFYSINL